MSVQKEERRRFVKNTSWLFAAKSAPTAVNFLEVMVLARAIGLEGLGLFTLVVAYVGTVSRLLDLRVWEVAVKYVGEFLEKKDTDRVLATIKLCYSVDLLTGFLALSVAAALASFASEVFIGSPDGFWMILLLSLTLPFAGANATSEALFRVFGRFGTVTLVLLSEASLKLIFILVVLQLGHGITGVLFVYIAVSSFGFALRHALVAGMLRRKGLGAWFWSSTGLLFGKRKEMAWFMLNTGADATMAVAGEGRVAALVLGYFSGVDATGLYRVTRSVIRAIGRLAGPIRDVMFPKLVGLRAVESRDGFIGLVRFASESLLKLAAPISLIVFLFAERFITAVFGMEYALAADTMRVMAVAALLSAATFWVGPVLLAAGRPGARTAVSAGKTLVYLVSLLAFVPAYSYMGAGLAFLVAEIFVFLIATVFVAYGTGRFSTVFRGRGTRFGQGIR